MIIARSLPISSPVNVIAWFRYCGTNDSRVTSSPSASIRSSDIFFSCFSFFGATDTPNLIASNMLSLLFWNRQLQSDSATNPVTFHFCEPLFSVSPTEILLLSAYIRSIAISPAFSGSFPSIRHTRLISSLFLKIRMVLPLSRGSST